MISRGNHHEGATGNNNIYPYLFRPIMWGTLAFGFLEFGLPVFAKALGAGAFQIGIILASFTLAGIVSRPFYGYLVDRFGGGRFISLAFLGIALAMGLFAFADSFFRLIVSRVVQGLAMAMFWVSIRTTVANLADPGDRGMLMGKVFEMVTRSSLTGALIGIPLISIYAPQIGWRYAFMVYALAALFGGYQVYRQVPADEKAPKPSSTNGFRVSADFIRLMIVVFMSAATISLIRPIYLIYLQDKFTLDSRLLALAFIPGGIVYGFLPSHVGHLSDRFGRGPLMAAGLFTAGLFTFGLVLAPGFIWLVVTYTISSIGWAMVDPAKAAMVADLTGRGHYGKGYALYELIAGVGAFCGPLVGGFFYDYLGKQVPFYITGSSLIAVALLAILFFGIKPNQKDGIVDVIPDH